MLNYDKFINEKISNKLHGFNYDEMWNNLLDKDPDDILNISINNDFKDGIILAIEMGANSYPLFNYGIIKNDLELVKLSLKNNVYIGNIHFIIKNISPEILEFMLDNNYIKKYDYDEWLSIAYEYKKYDICQILLKHGAKSNKDEKNKEEILHKSNKISTFDRFKNFINKNIIE